MTALLKRASAATLGPTLLLQGKPAEAVMALLNAIEDDPADYRAHYQLGAAQAALGQAADAAESLAMARRLHAFDIIGERLVDLDRLESDPAYAREMGDRFYASGHVGIASVLYELALEKPDAAIDTQLQYALSLQHLSLADQAAAEFAAVERRAPDNSITGQFALYSLFFVADGVSRHAAAARAWATRHERDHGAAPFANSLDAGRRLRIGYVAPCFTRGQIHQFVAPVIENHDRTAFEIFLYPNEPEAEAWSQNVTVRPLSALDDSKAAALIRRDRIDVLVDAWGHTVGNRLDVFMRRPAPVQTSWLNYQQTTGLSVMDYVLFADSVTAPDMDALFTETIRRVGPASAPFRPAHTDAPTPAPALKQDWVTFASFINPAKLSDETIAAWARILCGTPRSRLHLKYKYFLDPLLQQSTIARFAAYGVSAERLFFSGFSKGDAYSAAFGEVDMMLDTSPCPGGTTTLEAISRGVPVLIRTGETFYSRIAVQILSGAGMDDLVTHSWDDYVAAAIHAAGSPARLQDLRDRTARGFAAAPYRDEAAIVRRLEGAYQEMFARWRLRQAR